MRHSPPKPPSAEFEIATHLFGTVVFSRRGGSWYRQNRGSGPHFRVDESQVPESVLDAWRKSCAAPLKPGS